MTLVHLVRHAAHGEVGHVLTGRRAGIALGSAGQAEAEALARRLARRPLDAVRTSPRERCRQTAEAIAAPHGLAVEEDDDLDEIDFGRFSGRSFEDLSDDPAWLAWNRDRATARCPDGETMAEAATRMARALDRAARRAHVREIVLVTHADMIRAAVAAVLGLPLEAIFRFDVDPASVTTVVTEGSDRRLACLNAFGPLEASP